MTKKRRNSLINAGPDGPLNRVVPNHLLGLSISDQCDVHDLMFIRAKNSEELSEADEVFLENMMTQIENNPGPLSFGRKLLAYIYFGAVRIYSWLHR